MFDTALKPVHPIDLRTYLVADLATIGDGDVVRIVDEAVAGGATTVQIRGKLLSDAELLRVVTAVADRVDGRATLLVNDRVDVYLAAREAGAAVHGLHIGQSDGGPLEVRERIGAHAVLGLSAAKPEELAAAAALRPGVLDYLGVGAVRATPTKPDAPTPLGWEGLARAVAQAGPLPCVAIGGVGFGDAAEARAAGASGLAVVRAICSADDPRAAARELRDEWDRERIPNVLSIAGSDPSGGAGIQADLKSIQATGGYGMAAVTALTAQNTRGVSGVHTPPAEFLTSQLDAISNDVRIDAVKIGMLANAEVIQAVTEWIAALSPKPAVVLDPVMIATSGDRLLDADASRALDGLIALADVVTPNLPELAALLGADTASSWDEALGQARELASRHGVLVLAKGGHLDGDTAPDALVSAGGVVASFESPRIATTNTHGTGCSLSSALATIYARTGRGADAWTWSARLAHEWIHGAILAADALEVGSGSGPLDHAYATRAGLAAPRRDAELDAWWGDVLPIVEGIYGDDFVASLGDGTLDLARFETYIAQDSVYLFAYSDLLARAAELSADPAEKAFWRASSEAAVATEMELHRSRGAGERVPASPETEAYVAHLERAGGEHAVLIAALLPCFWIYEQVGLTLASKNHAGHPYGDWLSTYGSPEFTESTRQAIELVQRAAHRADRATLTRMREAFTLSSRHERAFFAQA
ncbi:thiamine biosynthesis multifunctional protein ThiED [Microbacterium sorbitolivorans]|uniref:Thiamine-phosphate synthase n=1 Tax=Microbacterium sorbitolivorans TaxID=1867410 RepID=A0A367YAZ6_9MICO|nr:bifunctional hydroxymethylpyrimidine kinase/phosphomethylpyrimidine kinase [Microbacterium sorbitolivorans]RCK62191.1 bifunctional hydroxymethylpyrimidine kinase/phosphomethylpyrimidine kinase [Microbacterium sorbitolivorans]GGF43992.1 thiamine biosynthesis multifunctional protein ThiED [Microbacterium sorbitolivorans]